MYVCVLLCVCVQCGARPLTVAAGSGRLDMVSALISNGADPNTDIEKFSVETPLVAAVRAGHTTICETLIKAGASVEEKVS